jgi:ABC-type multidrug transport system fused ATPase/permease subunit
VRKDLFFKLIHLDTAFYDESRTGDLLSRINSDTQVIQEGLSTSISMLVKAGATCIAMTIIMFTYSWELTIYALLLITPSVSVGRLFYSLFMHSNEMFQDAKAGLGSIAQESFGNIRTLKAFANEKQTLEKYDVENAYVYDTGLYKAKVYGGFYVCITVLQSSAFCMILYIISLQYDKHNLTVGTCIAYLLYMKKIVDTFSEMLNASQQVARVKGASMAIAELLVREN